MRCSKFTIWGLMLHYYKFVFSLFFFMVLLYSSKLFNKVFNPSIIIIREIPMCLLTHLWNVYTIISVWLINYFSSPVNCRFLILLNSFNKFSYFSSSILNISLFKFLSFKFYSDLSINALSSILLIKSDNL